jgi:hypothetical protein
LFGPLTDDASLLAVDLDDAEVGEPEPTLPPLRADDADPDGLSLSLLEAVPEVESSA